MIQIKKQRIQRLQKEGN